MNFDDLNGRDTTAPRQWANGGVRAYPRSSAWQQARQPKG
ncbi:hypothetical protein SAMN05446635_6704 [Burkholderia sp. OK233]|nr:hypothetical protein SAMN05446635_6704 [Burkholderia sp. OK233]